jgi:hypothetical protein
LARDSYESDRRKKKLRRARDGVEALTDGEPVIAPSDVTIPGTSIQVNLSVAMISKLAQLYIQHPRI